MKYEDWKYLVSPILCILLLLLGGVCVCIHETTYPYGYGHCGVYTYPFRDYAVPLVYFGLFIVGLVSSRMAEKEGDIEHIFEPLSVSFKKCCKCGTKYSSREYEYCPVCGVKLESEELCMHALWGLGIVYSGIIAMILGIIGMIITGVKEYLDREKQPMVETILVQKP